MWTGGVSTIQTHELPIKQLIWGQQVETFGFRVNSGVLCPDPSERLISTLWRWPSFRTKCSPRHGWLTRYGLLRNQCEEKGLEQGSGVSDGWSIFLDKRFHKVDDFCVRTGHNTSPICSRLATGQLCCNCHCWGKPFEWCRVKLKEAETARWMTTPLL